MTPWPPGTGGAMPTKPAAVVLAWLPDGVLPRLAAEFPDFEFLDARDPTVFDRRFRDAVIAYGLPPVARLGEAPQLRWVQLISAGVPQALCPAARDRGITITNLAGLYGLSIAEHALGLMTVLSRGFHLALRNQQQRRWDRDLARGMTDLRGKTLAVLGLGNIGRGI